MFNVLSACNIVTALASTGSVSTNSADDTSIAQANSGMCASLRGFVLPTIVLIKLVALNSEDAQAKYTAFITWFTEFPAWCVASDRGGYRVQPVPAPYSVGVPFVNSERMV